MKSLKSLCFDALARGRAWDVLEAGAMTNNGAQRIEVCLDVMAEHYRVGIRQHDFNYNHHIHWTLDVVSAEATTLQTGDLCLIRSDAKHRVALAWFDGCQDQKCVLMLVSPETARIEKAFRNLDEVWAVQGMPPIKINPNGCSTSPTSVIGSPLTCTKRGGAGQKTSAFCCFLVHFVHNKKNRVAPMTEFNKK